MVAGGDAPSSHDRRRRADEILQLTRSMHRLATEGDWDALVEQEQRRRPLLDGLFSRPFPATDSPWAAVFIRQVLALDKETMELARAGRDDLAGGLGAIGRGRKATKAYDASR
jgi:hypothetical protein